MSFSRRSPFPSGGDVPAGRADAVVDADVHDGRRHLEIPQLSALHAKVDPQVPDAAFPREQDDEAVPFRGIRPYAQVVRGLAYDFFPAKTGYLEESLVDLEEAAVREARDRNDVGVAEDGGGEEIFGVRISAADIIAIISEADENSRFLGTYRLFCRDPALPRPGSCLSSFQPAERGSDREASAAEGSCSKRSS